MPLTSFICPDHNVRPVSECLDKCPLPTGRCLAMAHLVAISEQRPWRGKASVTQLIQPTRIAWLTIKKPYSVIPHEQAYLLYGTLHHKRLEIINKKLDGLSEYGIGDDEGISGVLDRLEPDELMPGTFKLIDFKLTGAYAIAKALGYKSADGQADMREWELQLNKYRLMIESDSKLAPLFPISRMMIQATVRDSGLRQIEELKLPSRMPLIPVKKIDDLEVFYFFHDKQLALMKHLEENTLPPMCNYEESWANRRCRAYCNVMPFCPEGAKVNKVVLRE